MPREPFSVTTTRTTEGSKSSVFSVSDTVSNHLVAHDSMSHFHRFDYPVDMDSFLTLPTAIDSKLGGPPGKKLLSVKSSSQLSGNPTVFSGNLPSDIVSFSPISPSLTYNPIVVQTTSNNIEPTSAFVGKYGMSVGNVFAAVTNNMGSSWTSLNVNQNPPPVADSQGLPIGDQWVYYVPSRDIFIWQSMYNSNASNTRNAIRISSTSASNFKSTSNITWCNHYIVPATLGATGNVFLDRPDGAMGDNFMWFTATQFGLPAMNDLGASVYAISLDQLADSTCPNLTVHSTFNSGEVVPVLTNGANSTMFWAYHDSIAALTIYSRSESLTAPVGPTTATHSSSPNVSSWTCNTPNGMNLCLQSGIKAMVGWAANGQIGFLWNAGPGTGGLGTFPFPYVQEAVYNQSSLANPVLERQLSSPTGTYMYPSVATNNRGHLGGSITYMENGSYPSSVVWIADDFGSGTNSSALLITPSNNAISPRWGDYFSSSRHSSAASSWVATNLDVSLPSNVLSYTSWFGRYRDYVSPSMPRLGLFRPSNKYFFLDYDNSHNYSANPVDREFLFSTTGAPSPIVGDWIGVGFQRVGLFKNSGGTPGSGIWLLDSNGNGKNDSADKTYTFGYGTDLPVVGKWNNSSASSRIGTFRYGTPAGWSLDLNGNGVWDASDGYYSSFGSTGEIPIVGDWNGDGVDDIGTVGVSGAYRKFYLDYNGNHIFDGCTIDRCYTFGLAGDIPIVGKWDDSSKSKIGVATKNTTTNRLDYYLDYDGNGIWNSAVDKFYPGYGYPTDVPIVGVWLGVR